MKKTLLGSVAAAVLLVGTTLAIAQSSGTGGGGAGASGGGAGASGSGAVAPGGAGSSGEAGGANIKAKSPDEKGSSDTRRQSQGNASDQDTQGQKKSKQKAVDQKSVDQKSVDQKSAPPDAQPQKAKVQNQEQNAQGTSGAPKQVDGKVANQGGSKETTGNIGSGASVTTEQRTQLREKISNVNLRRVNNVNFTVSVGTAIPRTVTYYDMPPDIVRVMPAYRRYKYILVGNQLIIIDPRRRIIIDVIDV